MTINFKSDLNSIVQETKLTINGILNKGADLLPSGLAHSAGLLADAGAPGLYAIAIPLAAAGKVIQYKDYAFSSLDNFKEVALYGIGQLLTVRNLVILGSLGAAVAISGCEDTAPTIFVQGGTPHIIGPVSGHNVTFNGSTNVTATGSIDCDDSLFQGDRNVIAGKVSGTNITFLGNVTVRPGAEIACDNSVFKDCDIGGSFRCSHAYVERLILGIESFVEGCKGYFENVSFGQRNKINLGVMVGEDRDYGPINMKDSQFGDDGVVGQYVEAKHLIAANNVTVEGRNNLENVTAENDSHIYSGNVLKNGLIKTGAHVAEPSLGKNNKIIANDFVFG